MLVVCRKSRIRSSSEFIPGISLRLAWFVAINLGLTEICEGISSCLDRLFAMYYICGIHHWWVIASRDFYQNCHHDNVLNHSLLNSDLGMFLAEMSSYFAGVYLVCYGFMFKKTMTLMEQIDPATGSFIIHTSLVFNVLLCYNGVSV